MAKIPLKLGPVLPIVLPGNVASWVREIQDMFESDEGTPGVKILLF